MNVADRLKQLMKEKGITAKELVELCQPFCLRYNEKIDKTYVSKYLNGSVIPKMKKLSILALALNTNEGYLMGLVSFKEPQKLDSIETKEVIEKIRKLDMFDLGKISNQIDVMLEADKYKEIKSLKTA